MTKWLRFSTWPNSTNEQFLDLAIRGDGFFLAQKDNAPPFLTRRGDMQINNENILNQCSQ